MLVRISGDISVDLYPQHTVEVQSYDATPVARPTKTEVELQVPAGLSLAAGPLCIGFASEADADKFVDAISKSQVDVFHLTRNEHSTKEYFGYYAKLSQQQNMLADFIRTGTYQNACLQNPTDFCGKVVCDLGCGTGLLSVFAAQAGAKKVYGVEASAMADIARTLVAANHLDDTITIIKGKAEEIELPEQVDLVISEPMGIALVNERMLESFVCARKWLRPGGKMYPTTSFLYCAPFSDEQLYSEVVQRSTFFDNAAFFGINLRAVKHAAFLENMAQPVVEAFEPQRLVCPPSSIEIDYSTIGLADFEQFECPVSCTVARATPVHGVALWFDVVFDGSDQRVILSTAPTSGTTHWYQVRCLLHSPVMIPAGRTLSGSVKMRANRKQSYDIDIAVEVEGTSIKSVGKVDLKDPFFRYMAYQTPLNADPTPKQFADQAPTINQQATAMLTEVAAGGGTSGRVAAPGQIEPEHPG